MYWWHSASRILAMHWRHSSTIVITMHWWHWSSRIISECSSRVVSMQRHSSTRIFAMHWSSSRIFSMHRWSSSRVVVHRRWSSAHIIDWLLWARTARVPRKSTPRIHSRSKRWLIIRRWHVWLTRRRPLGRERPLISHSLVLVVGWTER
jgi:hypothetical protein